MVDQRSESRASFGHDLVGEYVGGDDGSSVAGRILLGKVASFDGGTKLFKVIYEDGQSEGLEHQEVQNILLVDNGGSGMKMSVRKRKLDQLVPSVLATNGPNTRSKKNPLEMVPNGAPQAQPLVSRLGSDLSRDTDSSCDADSSMQQSVMPSLPPSSGDLSVPEDSVPNLLSVYNFLRSFSLRLFLSPFGLHDFVGALNCMSQNSLMDAIHLSLMQSLRRHLETLSSEGSVLATKCLRRHDWTLLDTLTWPAFLVEYLCIMGFMKGLQKEGFSVGALQCEYYCLHVAIKLKVLQILCDDMIGSSELRTELEMREDLEEEKENVIDATSPLENSPRRVHPRHSKTSAWKNMQALESSAEAKNSDPIPTVMELGTDATNASPDGNSDECMLCGMDGTLICCDSCPSSYHSRCIGLNKASLPDGLWFCPECTVNKLGPTSSRIGRGTSGAEVFGIDTYGHLFMGTCNYLLVIDTSSSAESSCRYYNQDDVVKVLSVICSTREHLSVYEDICRGVSKYWELPLIMQSDKVESAGNSHGDKEPAEGYVPFSIDSDKNKLFCDGERENQLCITTVNTENKDILCRKENDEKCETRMPEAIDGASFQSNVATHASGNETGTCREDASSSIHSKKSDSISASYEKCIHDKSWNNSSFLRSNAYSNHYVLGDIAASAATNLAVLASEERRVSDSQMASNPRKIMAANTVLQTKAFSGAAIRFMWMSHEKKQMEVPRERCGWCITCRSSKKGCLMNQAASSAIKRFTKSISGLHSIKQDGSHLPVIAAHITNMEESLHGLIVGPFLDVDFIQQWRKQIREASLKDLKYLLLELEKNIRSIAFSRDWMKIVDDWPMESSATQTNIRTGPIQKHGSVGRRNKRQSAASEFVEAYNESRDDVQWWRGEKLSKLVFLKGVLPSLLVKRAARQGGRRWISGINYTESPELPRRNRQFAWRASVEMSKNAAQLALQVRYLDAHLRWRDLVRPDQTPRVGKKSDADAIAFKNSHICYKKLVENKIVYALIFDNRNHLPLRVMKKVLESEKTDNGNDKLWFSENHVPLYLIKEFEEKADVKLGSHCLMKSKKKQLKFYWRDIFSYLLIKLEKPSKFSCGACHVDVLLRDSVKCNTCQDYCHKNCTVSSTMRNDGNTELLFTCNPCYCAKCASCQLDVLLRDAVKCNTCEGHCHKNCTVSLTVKKDDNLWSLLLCSTCYRAKCAEIAKNHQEALNLQLSSQAQAQQPTGIKCVLRLGSHKNTQENEKLEGHLVKSSLASSSRKEHKERKRRESSLTYGLIWKKNVKDEKIFGTSFLVENIIYKRKEGVEPSSIQPVCRLCHSEYRSDLMYVRCQTCQYWYHADALNLEESLLSDLLGFRCCKCRRIASPRCPYQKLDVGHSRQRNAGRSKRATSKLVRSTHDTTLLPQSGEGEDLIMLDDEPSLGSIDPLDENAEIDIDLMPRKLSKKRDAWQNGLSHGFPELASHYSIQDFETKPEDLAVVGDDPLLPSSGRVEPFDQNQTFEIEAQPNGSLLSLQGQQKLSIRRSQLNHETTTYARNGADSNELYAVDGSDFMNAEENSQLGWEYSNVYDYENEGFDPDSENIECMEYEPQTYFSFTELLPEDDQLDNGVDLDMDNGSNDLEIVNQNLPSDQSGAYNVNPTAANAPSFIGEVCEICNLEQPSPDLMCEICGLCIHSRCSPWVERDGGATNWRCGDCREWR